MTRYRDVLELHTGHPASDGAGVRLTRVIGGRPRNASIRS